MTFDVYDVFVYGINWMSLLNFRIYKTVWQRLPYPFSNTRKCTTIDVYLQGRIQEFIMGGPGWVRGDHQSYGRIQDFRLVGAFNLDG